MNETKLQQFLEKFVDDQVGLEIASAEIYNDAISVRVHKQIIEARNKKREGRTIAPSGKTYEECDKLARDEWKIAAEELIELLSYDRNGGALWELRAVSENGFVLEKV